MHSQSLRPDQRRRLNQEFRKEPGRLFLNHAAISPWPVCASEAVKRFADENCETGPLHYRDWISRERALRNQLVELIGAKSDRDIALLKNTTEGISTVAWGLDWQQGDSMVLPAGEFPSNRLPWLAQQRHGVEIREIDIRAADNAEDALIAAMDDSTRLLSVSAVQWNDGFRLDLERLGKACHSRGVLFFVDAIQQLGVLPLSVERCHIDFLAADAHKWMLGPEGIAVFYCREHMREILKLHQLGWHMADNPWNFTDENPLPSSSAKRFEAGSPNTLGQVAMHASLELLLDIGMTAIAERVLANTRWLINQVNLMPELELTNSPEPERWSGIVCIRHRKLDQRRLHKHLSEAGITTALRGGSVRISPHFYQDRDDLGQLIEVLKKL